MHNKTTIFSILSSLFTAVTFHELFKAAALDANAKLQFGIQSAAIFKELGAVCTEVDMPALKAKFDELDADQKGVVKAGNEPYVRAVVKELSGDAVVIELSGGASGSACADGGRRTACSDEAHAAPKAPKEEVKAEGEDGGCVIQ